MDLYKQREEAKRRLADLEVQIINEEKRQASMTDVHRLAELVHGTTCYMNHTDQCDWEYGDWDDFKLNYSRQNAMNTAHKMLKVATFLQAKAILGCLR